MSESARTLAYAGVAAASVVIAGLYGWATQPTGVTGFDSVGTEFYPDFRDPSDADSLRVVAYNEDTARSREFAVARQESGEWVIPSHYDYPADAREKLNKTANSIIGIKRGAQKGSRENEHKEFGVLDPLSEDSGFEGRGKRITLKKGDEVLVDYIIGKKVKDEENLYYVRLPEENEVYLAEVDVELSTSFGDWIESDLLKISRNDLVEITVNKYSIDERQGRIMDQEVSVLTREKSFDPWKLEGLNEDTEELKTKEINDLVDALDNLKIVGVRPKPKGINGDLTIDREFVKSQNQLDTLRAELQMRGFFIAPGENNTTQLLANEGNVMAATEDGLVYKLNFGELFSGSLEEIEIGNTKKDEDSGEDKADDEPSMSLKNSRYLFVSVSFDKKFLGEEPTKPAEPQKPEGLIEQEAEQQADEPEAAKEGEEKKEDKADECGGFQEEQQADDEAKQENKPATGGEAGEKPSDEKPEPTKEEKQKALEAEWARTQIDYQRELKEYQSKLDEYNAKLKAAQKEVDELNRRLGAWYYVISGESFETLRLARADLVKPKEKKDEPRKDTNPTGAGDNPEPAGQQPKAGEPAPPKSAEPPVQKDEQKKPAPANEEKPADSPPASNDEKPEASNEKSDPKASEKPEEEKAASGKSGEDQ